MDISRIMYEKRVNKAELARRMGITKQSINAAMQNPTETTIRRMADALGVEVWELFADEETRERGLHGQGLTCPVCGSPLRVDVITFSPAPDAKD
ncbi:MAG: helix-turn-helix domain-containing protein [Prevotella sp.]|nr:helix-turn-helix domain-containing protein [Prevotella sp.]